MWYITSPIFEQGTQLNSVLVLKGGRSLRLRGVSTYAKNPFPFSWTKIHGKRKAFLVLFVIQFQKAWFIIFRFHERNHQSRNTVHEQFSCTLSIPWHWTHDIKKPSNRIHDIIPDNSVSSLRIPVCSNFQHYGQNLIYVYRR